jgi:heterotetrameric sarcosine oxidase alpha subunit
MSIVGLRHGLRLKAESLSFTFDGRRYGAQVGDTAASALLANGVRALGRSVKYRRLRGVVTAGPEEPNALLTVGAAPEVIPNVPAPQLVLHDGIELRSQNRWPTLNFDLASVLQAGGGLLGAGFYYKTFLWPSWHSYEGIIRRLAGLGEAPGRSELPPVNCEHLNCDVLIAGAGAAGLAAARAAARAGAQTVLCEREPQCGGELEFEAALIDGQSAHEWTRSTLAELQSLGVRVLTDTALIAESDGRLLAHAEPGGLPGRNTVYRIRPRAFIVATGAIERSIAFCDNDRPGVMLLGAAERYLARYGARAGEQLVLFGNHDRLYASARRLMAGGMHVRAIVDTRAKQDLSVDSALAKLRELLQGDGVECLNGHAVIGAEGRGALNAACVASLNGTGSMRRMSCDAILVSGGWSPSVHAGLQHGGSAQFTADIGAFVAGNQPTGRALTGSSRGLLELGAVLADGHAAGERAAREAGASRPAGPAPSGNGDAPPALVAFARSPAPEAAQKRQFIDLQNDVTVADLRTALAEGFQDIEHIKRYTTLGVGTDQGRGGGLLGAAIVAELKGESLATIGVIRARPPYQPITMRSIAGFRVGAAVKVTRRTPLHEWHVAHGGMLEPMGLWMRPRYYLANGADPATAAIVESRRVRSQGGIADSSTLGKLEIAGPDAPAFLDFLYLTKASAIRPGRSKYMVNLREDGMVLDDGLVLRLAEDRFMATTSSGHGTHMLSHFEHYRSTQWADRAVTITDVTEAWAAIAVAGPESRPILQRVLEAPWHASLDRLKHMEFADGQHRGQELRVLRASFSGELAYELHCRPAAAPLIWEALVGAGLSPYGIDALDVLRVEKGYLVASEINGETTPLDLGMQALVQQGNACLGRELLERPAFHEAARPRLVGLRAMDGHAQFLAGAQLTVTGSAARPCGHVTSSVFSPALGEWLGLALVARELAAEAAILSARDPLRARNTPVRIVSPVHFDPAGARMKA